MTYYENVHTWEESRRELLLKWLDEEDINADEVVDDGQFGVQNGRISGTRFIFNSDGEKIVDRRHRQFLKVPFNIKQKNPLPEGL